MEMLIGILKALLLGLKDSITGTVMIYYLDKKIREEAIQRSPLNDGTPRRRPPHAPQTQRKDEQPKILRRTMQCCLLNGGVFLCSILLFDWVLLPALRSLLSLLLADAGLGEATWAVMRPALTWTFGTFWVLPIFIISKVVNALWFQDIADSAFRHTRGTPQQFSSLSKLVADTLFSILVQALFLAQTMVVGLLPIPVLAELLSLVHMCLLYSLYSFEYKWFNMGWELHHRLTYIENNWPYFIGFGLPLAFFTGLPTSYIYSGCIFSILFPLFIISGNEADPVTNVCDTRLKLFSPVITISNTLFNRTIGARAVVR